MAIVRWGHETQIADIDWLWEPMIPYGKVTIVEGDGGDGKTTLILTVAAMLSFLLNGSRAALLRSSGQGPPFQASV